MRKTVTKLQLKMAETILSGNRCFYYDDNKFQKHKFSLNSETVRARAKQMKFWGSHVLSMVSAKHFSTF